MKVISFSQQGPRAICILSATGVISSVRFHQPGSSGGTLTYEGQFGIVSMSGSFMQSETGGTRNSSDGMSGSRRPRWMSHWWSSCRSNGSCQSCADCCGQLPSWKSA